MQIRISRSWLRLLIVLAIAASVFVLFTTATTINFWRQYPGDWVDAPIHRKIATFINLAEENNLAAWFSSMLLATIGWLAILCFLFDRQRKDHDWLAYGWLIMALGFVALSFDELASLHERMWLPRNIAGTILWYAPVMVVLPAYMGLFAFSRMRSDKLALLLIAIGSLAFASIPIQEYFEVEVLGADGRHRPVFQILLEEGGELFAMLAILAAFARYVLRFLPPPTTERRGSAYLHIKGLTFLFAIVSVVAAGLVLTEIAARLLRQDEFSGIVRHWLPAWTCFGAAWLAWHSSARDTPAGNLVLGQLAAVCVALSALVGGSLYGYFSLVAVLSFWVVITWVTGAFLLRSSGWIIGSGLWAVSVVASLNLLSSSVMPAAVALSTLLLAPGLTVDLNTCKRQGRLSDILST